MRPEVNICQNKTIFGFPIRAFRINTYAGMRDKEGTFYISVTFKMR